VRILSFDTSTERLQVALLQDGEVACERSLDANADLNATHVALAMPIKARQSEQFGPGAALPPPRGRMSRTPRKVAPRQEIVTALLPMIDSALLEVGWDKTSLDCIVVGIGPGSFTAIRTGVVTARTLAQALKLPLVPVSLLETYASLCQLPCAVVLAAGKEHCFAAAYTKSSDSGQIGAPAYVEAAKLGLWLAACERWAVSKSLFETLASPERVLLELPDVKNIATRQGQIGWNRLSLTMSAKPDSDSQAETGSVAIRARLHKLFPYSAVLPLYLRNPSITLKASITPASHAT
jgi:tRNA threonylcarbamoyl adenosine modification protein YeaZ